MLTITFHKLLMYTTFSYFTNATKYNIKRNKSTKYQNQHQACTPTKLKAYPSLHGSHLRITEPCNLLSKVAEKKPKHLNLVRGTCPTYSPYYYQPQLKNFMTNMHLSPQSQVPNLKMPNIKNIKDFWNTGERKKQDTTSKNLPTRVKTLKLTPFTLVQFTTPRKLGAFPLSYEAKIQKPKSNKNGNPFKTCLVIHLIACLVWFSASRQIFNKLSMVSCITDVCPITHYTFRNPIQTHVQPITFTTYLYLIACSA